VPVLPIDDRGVAEAVQALRAGAPIVIPAPSPLAYAVAGTDAAAVNTAKNRPATQPAGVSVADLDVIAPSIVADFGHLYMSSANVTGSRSAVTAAEAGQAFGEKLIVLDGDPYRDQSRPQGSTTMVRLSRDGHLAVARPGINNAAFGADLAGYAADLTRRWRRRSPATEAGKRGSRHSAWSVSFSSFITSSTEPSRTAPAPTSEPRSR
jgi:tRNA A37 threonylcarbamoyladenosine synthetase subunit TsaC/SUA5/YrdC